MKATIAKFETLLTMIITFDENGKATMAAKLMGPGNPPKWSGELTNEEAAQLKYRLAVITGKEIAIEGAEDLVRSNSAFTKTIRDQATSIDSLKARAENAEKELEENKQAVINQRELIDTLRGKLARTDAQVSGANDKPKTEAKPKEDVQSEPEPNGQTVVEDVQSEPQEEASQ